MYVKQFFDINLRMAHDGAMPKSLPVIDTTAPVCCSPIGAGAVDAETALQIALRLKALADPVRVQLVSLLFAASDPGARTVDLAPVLGLSEATVSHHLKQLREAGLIEGLKSATNTYYRPVAANLVALSRVLDPCC